MKKTYYFLSLFLPALLFISSAIAIVLPEGYIIPQETLSPTHRYGFMTPMLKSFLSNNVSNMDNLHNSLIDMKTGKIIADINAAYGFDRSVNYEKIVPPWWSKDESLVLWQIHGKWSPRTLVLVAFKNDTLLWQLNLLTIFQKEILAHTKAVAPERYEAAKKANAGCGAAFPDGFMVDVEPVMESDISKQTPLKLPLHVHVTLTSNPKQVENIPNLNAEMDGIIKKDGSSEVKNFKLLKP